MSGKENPIRIAKKLQQESYKLFYPLDGDEYSYMDKYQEINSKIVRWRRKLVRISGDTVEEEAEICLALLMGCNAYIRDNSGITEALTRTHDILPVLPSGVLKCMLLVFCYGEEYDEKILGELCEIVDTWEGRDLSAWEQMVVTILKDIEENAPHQENMC